MAVKFLRLRPGAKMAEVIRVINDAAEKTEKEFFRLENKISDLEKKLDEYTSSVTEGEV